MATVIRGCRGVDRREGGRTGGTQGIFRVAWDTAVADPCHREFVQTPGVGTKSEP